MERFREAKSAKAEENRAECTDAKIFDLRRGQGRRLKFYKRLTNAARGILAQCRERTPPPRRKYILRKISLKMGVLVRNEE